jgi:hypothetical protein
MEIEPPRPTHFSLLEQSTLKASTYKRLQARILQNAIDMLRYRGYGLRAWIAPGLIMFFARME